MGRQQMKKPWCGLLLMYKYNQLVVGVVSPAGGGCGLTCWWWVWSHLLILVSGKWEHPVVHVVHHPG